ncbi:isopenicillin N synthetase [Fonsecaea monophora]|uniref:Isopenicillin N synthetase n=1 Tax=Fonsecaea monophora TaxID=254056 RepID=A0A177EPP3_9EURO|nr:isopenicillin N synthetase [Fonsecaea monophora]OAG33898.1 isopenicillin N synthetase [Fonsecaea monophora]
MGGGEISRGNPGSAGGSPPPQVLDQHKWLDKRMKKTKESNQGDATDHPVVGYTFRGERQAAWANVGVGIFWRSSITGRSMIVDLMYTAWVGADQQLAVPREPLRRWPREVRPAAEDGQGGTMAVEVSADCDVTNIIEYNAQGLGPAARVVGQEHAHVRASVCAFLARVWPGAPCPCGTPSPNNNAARS